MLDRYGWSSFFQEGFASLAEEGDEPGRVLREHRGLYRVLGEAGELVGVAAGRLRHRATGRGSLPSVGDWIVMRPASHGPRATITAVLPRRSAFVRKVAGDVASEQVVAANVDTVFLVSGLDGNFNLRRIERYLVAAWESGAAPVVVLNKADLCDDVAARVRGVEEVAPGVPVHAVDTRGPNGLAPLGAYMVAGRTVALLGSSGVGKSSIINRLLGAERLATREVRADDDRGRHTTTDRQLLLLPGGALVIDTPGMRELQLWEAGSSLGLAFEDVAELAGSCRFRDCRHRDEPGCAVTKAAHEGSLPMERLASFHKLQAELDHLAVKTDARAESEEKRRVRALHRLARKHQPRG
jgi:ribosome biogenesis GTPase